MKHIITAIILAACGIAHATDCGTGGLTYWDAASEVCRPAESPNRERQPAQPVTVSPSIGVGAEAGASSAASANVKADQQSAINNDSRYYVMPAPVAAAPLPAGMCQRSSSRAFAIGWNFLSYGRSDSRTEIECLERAFSAMPRPQAPMQLSDPRLAHPIPPHETVILVPAQSLERAPTPRKRKAVAVVAPKCGATEVLRCVPRGM